MTDHQWIKHGMDMWVPLPLGFFNPWPLICRKLNINSQKKKKKKKGYCRNKSYWSLYKGPTEYKSLQLLWIYSFTAFLEISNELEKIIMFLKMKYSNKPVLLYFEMSSIVYFLQVPIMIKLFVFLCEQSNSFSIIFLKVAPLQRSVSLAKGYF